MARCASTFWVCDFLTVRSLTTKRFVALFVLFFIHVGSRRVFVAGVAVSRRDCESFGGRNSGPEPNPPGMPSDPKLSLPKPRLRPAFEDAWDAGQS